MHSLQQRDQRKIGDWQDAEDGIAAESHKIETLSAAGTLVGLGDRSNRGISGSGMDSSDITLDRPFTGSAIFSFRPKCHK